ncbi:KH domain-containing protein [Aeromicrobium sp.]|nr:KH domain-containing protein [Candidatus Saccharibacteria bacterium]
MDHSIDQQFVEYVVKSLVGNPDAVQVDRRIDEKGVLLELTVDPEDLGRVIGKRGATAQSLRTLLRALGTKNEARYNLKIIDNGEPRPDHNASGSDASNASHNDHSYASTLTEDSAPSSVSSTSRDLSDLSDDDDRSTARPEPQHNDAVSKTRRELAELDDLDI